MYKRKIIGIRLKYLYTEEINVFGGFLLEGDLGSVNISYKELMPELLKNLVDEDGNIITKNKIEFLEKELEWAYEQIGKTLEFDNLVTKIVVIEGNVKIT